MKELTKAAKKLFNLRPTPWTIFDDGFYGFVKDANGISIFGGEPCEGRVDATDKDIVALIKTINALGEFLKEE